MSARLRAAILAAPVTLLFVRRPNRRVTPRGTRVFALAAEPVLRAGDVLAYHSARACFVFAMFAPARRESASPMLDARSALERIVAATAEDSDERVDLGWWRLSRCEDLDDIGSTIDRAFERGARERERFEFLATIGHELRTPLTSIRGYVETLLDDEIDTVTARRFLEIVRDEALRLGRLVDGMLEFSLLDLSVDAFAERTDVAVTVAAAVEALSPLALRAGIALRARIDDPTTAARIGGDACAHVVLNLIENGLKYGRTGGCVVVSLEREAASLRIVVDDDGPGIEPAERRRIFEYRARGARAGEQPGSGIGLAIVRTIVERVGGSVEVTRSPLGGARFVVALPEAESVALPS